MVFTTKRTCHTTVKVAIASGLRIVKLVVVIAQQHFASVYSSPSPGIRLSIRPHRNSSKVDARPLNSKRVVPETHLENILAGAHIVL